MMSRAPSGVKDWEALWKRDIQEIPAEVNGCPMGGQTRQEAGFPFDWKDF